LHEGDQRFDLRDGEAGIAVGSVPQGEHDLGAPSRSPIGQPAGLLADDGDLQSLARTAVENSQSAYWLAMATLGVGSIFFCRALIRSALLLRF